MLLKPGTDISRIKPAIREKLDDINQIVYTPDEYEMVITSTYEGNHRPGSLHYANLAIDIKNPKHPKKTIDTLRKELGEDYAVVGELDHIHIEYDPKH